ncbi:hypothetical protein MHI04_15325 [Lysinibacillus sp. FSL K6-1151]|uniref:hypothetical protein n=1 Tax=Lysinibacillus sp. FSL K6-1151 TaxID=2921465 RepID=UPI00315A3331
MQTRVGRKKTDFPVGKYKYILSSFLKNKPNTTKISYLGISKHATELFHENNIDILISHHYWKNGVGKRLVDEYNSLLNHQESLNPSETIISTRETVNKFPVADDNSKRKLISTLEMNEKKLYRYVEKNKKLENQIQILENEVNDLKILNQSLSKKIEYYENTLFQWLELSNKKDIPLINLSNTSKSRNKFTEKFLKDIFTENPFDLFKQITSLNHEEYLDKNTINFNIRKKQKDSLLDDFDL